MSHIEVKDSTSLFSCNSIVAASINGRSSRTNDKAPEISAYGTFVMTIFNQPCKLTSVNLQFHPNPGGERAKDHWPKWPCGATGVTGPGGSCASHGRPAAVVT